MPPVLPKGHFRDQKTLSKRLKNATTIVLTQDPQIKAQLVSKGGSLKNSPREENKGNFKYRNRLQSLEGKNQNTVQKPKIRNRIDSDEYERYNRPTSQSQQETHDFEKHNSNKIPPKKHYFSKVSDKDDYE